VAAACIVRGLTQKGLIHYPFTTNALRTAQDWYIPLTEIPLSVLVQTTTTGIQRGRTYVQVYLEITGVPVTLLTANYVTTGQPISWPDGNISAPTSGRGYIHTFAGTDPAANNEISEVVPTNTLWHLTAIQYQLDTDANIANRTSRLKISSETAVIMLFLEPNAVQAASVTRYYHWAPFLSVPAAFTEEIFGALPTLDLIAGAAIETLTDNFQAADDYGTPHFIVEEWIKP
jgi:hypothetical protein